MRTALTIAGVTLSGTALGVLAYTAVSVPSASPVSGNDASSSATVGKPNATTCEKPAQVIGSSCVTVVHVRNRGAGAAVSSRAIVSTTAATPTAPGTPSPALPSTFDDHGGDDEWDEDGSDHDDRGASGNRDDDGDERAQERDDARDDSADEREDRAEHREDVWEDLHDD